MSKEITYKINYKNGKFNPEEFREVILKMYKNWQKEQITMSCNNSTYPYKTSLTKFV